MIYCKNCGTKLPDGAKFCVNCGAKTKQDQPATVSKPTPPNGKVAKKKKPIYKRWWFWVIVVFLGIGFLPDGGDIDDAETQPEETDTVLLAFLDDFIEYGYTAEQIQEMKTVLSNVGVSDITDLEIQPVVSGMQVIKGKVYNEKRKDVDIQFNIENGVVYLVSIYCSNFWTSLDGLTDERADLFYDVEGGYLKKIDWESESVVDY